MAGSLPVTMHPNDPNAAGSIPGEADLLRMLRSGHPRLLASAGCFSRLKQRIADDKRSQDWHAQLCRRADHLVGEAPARYEIPDGVRLLAVSRQVVDRVYTLALVFRLDGGRRRLDRAWQELEAAAGFPDWNPNHFLDTAELTHALAIGYDWLFEHWTDRQRAVIRNAIIEKGLKPAAAAYETAPPQAGPPAGATRAHGWWTSVEHNWNQVCNGGVAVGALAVADEAPELAGRVLRQALTRLPDAMRHFAPDGAWAEGPGYWRYAMQYNVLILAALDAALGADFGLSGMAGFSEAGWFPIHLTGPTGRMFNFADGDDVVVRSPEMFWLARRFQRPAYAAHQCRVATPAPLDLLWRDGREEGFDISELPRDRYFRGAELVTMRGGWDDPDAMFVGFKAGDNKANHSHLDLGAFVLDALGQRWALDLGKDNYNLPGYWDRARQRWSYYRMRAEAHNTLVINPGAGPDQDPSAAARIRRFESHPDRPFAVADLTPAYAAHARRLWRGIALPGRDRLLVQDELELIAPGQVWWFLHTPAAVAITDAGRVATLSQHGKQLRAHLVSPADAMFSVMDAAPLPSSPNPPGQMANERVRKLAIRLRDVQRATIAVWLSPVRDGAAPGPLTEPLALAQW
jgi:hypothetical protein